MNRRSFFLNTIAGLAWFTQSRRAAGAVSATPAALRLCVNPDIRIAVVEGSESLLSGIRFGVQEAQHSARLIRGAVSAREFARTTVDAVFADRPNVVIYAGAPSNLSAFIAAAATSQFLLLNTSSPTGCGGFVFHLVGKREASELLWHDALERYGAEQLNARYKAAQSKRMDSDAYLGWLAVKIVWEAAARSRSSEPRALAEYLTQPGTIFDGHKGEPLRFDPQTRVLQQPYYRAIDLGPVTDVTHQISGTCDT